MAEAAERRRHLQAIIDADPDGPEAQLAQLELAAVEKGLQNFLRGLEDVAYRHRVSLDQERAAWIAQVYAAQSQGGGGRPGLVRQLLDVTKHRKASDGDRLQADMQRLENDQKAQVGAVVSTAGRIRKGLVAVDRQTASLAASVKASAEAFQCSEIGKDADRKIDQTAKKLGLSPAELRCQVHGWAKAIDAHLPAVRELRDWIRGKVASDPDLSEIKSQGRVNGIRRKAIDAMTSGLEKDISDAAASARDLGPDADLTKITDHLQASADRLAGLSDPADPAAVAALHEKMSEALERMLRSLSRLFARLLGRPAAGGRPRVVVDLPGP